MARPWTGLPEGAAAFHIAQVARGPTWVIAPDREEAERLVAELTWHGRKVAYFPADDGRAYEGLSPHPEMPRERILALHGLALGTVDIIVAPIRAETSLNPETLRVAWKTWAICR